MAQEQIQKRKTGTEVTHTEVTHTDVSNQEVAEATEEVLDNIDEVLSDQFDEELLAAIDDVLEKDATSFVAQYVQHGGE